MALSGKKKVARILLTERCNKACRHCFNAAYRRNIDMDMARFPVVIKSLASAGWQAIRVMGGEPTLHPQFNEAIRYIQSAGMRVRLFTNGTTDELKSFSPASKDIVTYNSATVILDDKDMFFPEYQWLQKRFEIVISDGGQDELEVIDNIVSKLTRHGIHLSPIGINLTLDATQDIVAKRDVLNRRLLAALKKGKELYYKTGLTTNIDHHIPHCFVSKEFKGFVLDESLPRSHPCIHSTDGLIGADYTIYHCNQYHRAGGNLFNKNGEMISVSEYLRILSRLHIEKLAVVAKRGCGFCTRFNIQCMGGCWGHCDVTRHPYKESR